MAASTALRLDGKASEDAARSAVSVWEGTEILPGVVALAGVAGVLLWAVLIYLVWAVVA